MGGYGSGGHNRIKGDVTECVRVDSFIEWHRRAAGAPVESVRAGVYDAIYFKCPQCGKRVRYLYMSTRTRFVCRDCRGLNYPCQQLPRHKWAVVKVLKILKRLDVDTENFSNQFELMAFEPERPEYKMSESEFFECQMQLFKYQVMWHDCICASARRIREHGNVEN